MEYTDASLSAATPAQPEMSLFPAKVSLAMAYVPYQAFENLYDESTAFSRGTLFKSLDFPFIGGKRHERS